MVRRHPAVGRAKATLNYIMPSPKKNTASSSRQQKPAAAIQAKSKLSSRPASLSKAAKPKRRLAKSAEVEILKPIRPKKVAQAIAIEVAEDSFGAQDLNRRGEPTGLREMARENINDQPLAEEYHIFSQSQIDPNRHLDKQENFFSQLAAEIKTEKNGSSRPAAETEAELEPIHREEAKHFKKSAGLYRRLVIKFVLAVAILFLVVAYFSFSKLTLYITPKTEHVGTTLELDVADATAATTATTTATTTANTTASATDQVNGQIQIVTVSGQKSYPAGGEDVIGEEISGQVKLINNYNKDQALVVKTRLLSPDNKLFRLKEAVNIPAGGSVMAAIYADEPSSEMAITPTRFSIPGLWAGLQDKIYAESGDKFVYQDKIKKYIKPSDFELATKDMNNYLLAQAQKQVSELSADNIVVYDIDVNTASSSFDSKAGDVKDNFNLQATSSVVFISFPKDQAKAKLKEKLGLSVPDDKELISYDEDPTYTLEKYDPLTKTAIIKTELNGLMALKKDSELIDRTKLLNLNREQIKQYLDNFPEISSYELKLTPSFINKAPGLVDRIEIKIKAPQL